jgi:alkanesulfonate monooxygenase SsuD/methylene tetrahydromethanopterin reductase-like flavin-dependent oxidoreductase (luciferase family)
MRGIDVTVHCATVKVGVIVPMSRGDGQERMPTWPDILAFVRHAEELGLHSAWVYDHFFYDDPSKPDDPPEGLHEAWTILSALAATTTRIRLGQLVMCSSFRHPGLLAKMAAAADEVSGGRVTLGMGAGWYEPEYRAFGYPYDHRVDRFEEALQIVRPLLRGERVTFDGTYHRTEDAALFPPPGHPIELLVAGREPRMLGLTARYADAWNTAWFGLPDERLHARLAGMAAALEAEGRDPSSLRMTVGLEVRDPDVPAEPDASGFAGPVDEVARALDAHQALGIDEAIVVLNPMNQRSLDRLAEATRLRG